MENLQITATKYTPEINFDGANHRLSIKGESYPENVTEFYAPVFKWIKNYLDQLEDQNVTVDIKLIYFNSSSSKTLMDLFDLLDEAAQEGKSIDINWIYEAGDEDTLEFGEEFQEDLESVTFNLVEQEA